MSTIEQSCYWFATRSQFVPAPLLEGDQSADVAIVGGGFTGLWTALFVKQLDPSVNVSVVEQGCVGYGASGRNAGIISASIDHSHALAVTHFGMEEAKRLAQLGLKNIAELAAFASECDFEPNQHLQVALTEKHIHDCKQSIEAAEQMGIEGHRWLSGEEVRQELNSPLYVGGVLTPGGGIINPIKLVDKIKTAGEALGVKYHEGTTVTGIKSGIVTSSHGRIKAGIVVLATDAYSHHLFPHLLHRFIPLYDYILVSEPLTAKQLEMIGWQNRQSVVDGRTFFNYYRLTADNRILWGTSEAMYYPPNRVDPGCDHSQLHYDGLKASFNRHFPQLTDVQFPFAWGGPIASTTRLTPFFGKADAGKVVYGLGYTGHGIGSTRLAGQILAHMALNRPSELLDLKMVKSPPLPYPPEPLRQLSVNAVTRSLRRVDQGHAPGLLLRALDACGMGFSS
jgi:glycine/D-amino acid oxidase-like deaminating enzyme